MDTQRWGAPATRPTSSTSGRCPSLAGGGGAQVASARASAAKTVRVMRNSIADAAGERSTSNTIAVAWPKGHNRQRTARTYEISANFVERLFGRRNASGNAAIVRGGTFVPRNREQVHAYQGFGRARSAGAERRAVHAVSQGQSRRCRGEQLLF